MTHAQLERNATINTGENDVSQFLSEVNRIPRLTPEEEWELAKKCAQGDENAIRRMVGANLRLVISVAREYAGQGVPLLDLIQEGSIGLISAAKKFDYKKNFRFSTYATKWIRQGVTRCLLNHAGIIRVPTYTGERMRKIDSVRRAFRQKEGREPSLDELSMLSGIPANKIQEITLLAPDVASLDATVGEEDGSTLALLLEDDQSVQPYQKLVRMELEQNINALMEKLSPRQRRIIRLHFGMEDGKCYSLEEIGKILGISKERVRQIERQAMDILQQNGSSLGLEDYLND